MTKETVALYLENGFKGRRNVISSRELERVLGISGNELRRRINLLRRDTVPIAADQRGYYFAETAAEVYATITALIVGIRNLNTIPKAVPQAHEISPSQLTPLKGFQSSFLPLPRIQ